MASIHCYGVNKFILPYHGKTDGWLIGMSPRKDNPGDRGQITTTIEGSTAREVIRAVAVRANEDPETLPPLNHVIDPDALEEVFGPRLNGMPRSGGSLVFHYACHRVKITENREVVVEPLSQQD